MSAGTAVAGVIALALGALGLLQLYGYQIVSVNLAIISTYLSFDGALVLFGAIAVIGLGLLIGGLATLGESETPRPVVQKEVVVVQPNPAPVVYAALSELELSVLRLLSQGKNEGEIAQGTGVSRPIVSEKVAKLRSEGYITDTHALTEKGFEALRTADSQRVYVSPAP